MLVELFRFNELYKVFIEMNPTIATMTRNIVNDCFLNIVETNHRVL